MIHPGAEIGNQSQPVTRRSNHLRIDPVGHTRHQNVAVLHRGNQFIPAHRMVRRVEHGIEQFLHPRFDAGQMTGDDDVGLVLKAAAGMVVHGA